MIDAGDSHLRSKNKRFINNLKQYFEDMEPAEVYISKILVTHAHPDHMGGLQDVLELLKERG